ncbi:MAG TPA: SDR family oxidoreductase [Gemmatimonadales bacterium]|jgi:NAD(P)-dependent dehydrogenase (short-subunit alcohol dehydrogenase family)|nr:SDR family oxidoreductase [Gemmatimonadales bacterium]
MSNENRTEHGKGGVVITGTSSGIGRASALLLARSGFQVFAGVRKPGDGDALRNDAGDPGDSVVPIILDVTDGASIAAAAAQVTRRLDGGSLRGVVNVAGIGMAGPIEYVTPDELRGMFEVDVFGQVAVIQAFLPLIRRSRGRIVNISSVGAHIAMPFGGVLGAAKSALGILSDALRLELRPFGIRVSTIEPGAINTPAVEKTLGNVEARIAKLPPEGATRYGDMWRAFTRRAYAMERDGSPPEVVAPVVLQALTARNPRARYVVGKHARVLTTLARVLPDRELDAVRSRLFSLPAAVGSEGS